MHCAHRNFVHFHGKRVFTKFHVSIHTASFGNGVISFRFYSIQSMIPIKLILPICLAIVVLVSSFHATLHNNLKWWNTRSLLQKETSFYSGVRITSLFPSLLTHRASLLLPLRQAGLPRQVCWRCVAPGNEGRAHPVPWSRQSDRTVHRASWYVFDEFIRIPFSWR
jgi:hypothetical protein